MNEFIKMDIFFVISTAAVVLLTPLAAIVLWRLSSVLKHIEHIAELAALESETIRLDLAQVRSDVRSGKGWLKLLLGFVDNKRKRAQKTSG